MIPRNRSHCALLVVLLAALGTPTVADEAARVVQVEIGPRRAYVYDPPRRTPESLVPILRHVDPGQDDFPEEKEALELSERLKALGDRWRAAATRATALEGFLTADFRGGRLVPAKETALPSEHPRVLRGDTSRDLVLDAAGFGAAMKAMLADFAAVHTAEMLIVALTVEGAKVRTVVRYDLVGAGPDLWRGQRIGRWQMRWRREAGTWRIAEWTALDHVRSAAATPIFTDVTGNAFGQVESFRTQLGPGHDAWLASIDAVFTPDTMALHGISTADVDGDGFDDLYVAQPTGLPSRLYRNRGDGRFEDVTEASGLGVMEGTSQSIFADVDNDGDQDAVLVVRAGIRLFTNDGRGHFTREAQAFTFKSPLRGSPTCASMGDYDRDGFLDIYLGTYSYFIGASEEKAGPATPHHDARNGPPNVLLRNDGRGRFADVTKETGLDENNDRFTLASTWGDFDGDGWIDLVVANDFGRKNLYRNLGASGAGAVRFKDVAAQAGVEDTGAGMSVTFLDYDHDGDLDLYTGNMWTSSGLRVTAHPDFLRGAPEEVRALYRRHSRGNTLFRNNGNGTFEDVTLATRTEMGRWAWASDVVDFDLDGWDDLFVVNGMFTRDERRRAEDLDSFFWRQVAARSPLDFRTGTSYDEGWRAINRLLIGDGWQATHERAVMLRNDGQGGFDEVSGTVGLDIDQDDRAFAVLDYDHDGDPDLAVYAPRASPQLRLFRNERPSGHASLAVRLKGTKGNRDAAGAVVTVETHSGARLVKTLAAASGFLSQHSKEVLFGLGRGGRARKISVRWPSGATQVFGEAPSGQRVFLEEGNDAVRTEAMAAPDAVAPAPLPPPAAPPSSTWLYEPYPAPDFTVADLAGRKVSRTALAGRPALLLLWHTAAPPSVVALQELSRHRGELDAAGLSVVALALDDAANASAVRRAATGVTIPVAMAGDDMAGTCSILNRFLFARRDRLRLPTAFLLNGKGEIVKAYRDEIEASALLADSKQMTVAPDARLARALPFPGAFQAAVGPRNMFPYALDLAEQGFEGAALGAFEQAAARDPNAITFFNLATLYIKKRRPADGRAALERALTLKPDYAEALNSLGALQAQGGDVPGGIARFRAALEAKPGFAEAMNNLGFALFQTGDETQAHALYEKALALRPDFPEAYNNLGIFHGQNGDLARAATYFKKAVAQRPEYGEAANNLAQVQMAQEDAPGAIRTLQDLLEKDPSFEMAYVNLARIYMRLGRPRESAQVLEQLLQRAPGHPMAVQMMRQLRGAP